jgi:hypothetical protein
VIATASGSRIYNSEIRYGDQSTITGEFYPSVTCTGKTTTRVDGLRFVDVGSGVFGCAVVENNYFDGVSATAVYTTGINDNDRINDNYFTNFNDGVMVDGDDNVSVDHNIFDLNHGIVTSTAITLPQGGDTEAVANVFLGAGDHLTFEWPTGDTNTYDQNYCASALDDCAFCRSSGRCETPNAGFVFP